MRLHPCPLPLLSLLALGCAGGSSGPLTPAPEHPGPGATGWASAGQASLGQPLIRGDLAESALAIFTVHIDPTVPSATVELTNARNAQATDDIYELSIERFTKPTTFSVRSIARGSATLDLTYAVSHPFAAPTDLNAPPTATNRADLSISGRVLFLTDVPSATGNAFFTGNGDVVANTEWVVNADAYYQPAGLLNLAGFTANTFPYKVLVDEAQDPRIGTATGAPISNGSNPRGNYSPTDGWQHHNIGPNNDGWTGFGVLHQGQTAFNDLRLALAPLTANPFQLQVAILAKYVDPRGGATAIEKRANRLPSNPPDITRFVYREPHGALDVERITFLGESGGFEPNIASGSTLRFHVVDWDARTPETTLPDLAQDPDPTHVATGESGFPALAVSIPGVLGDTTAVYDFTSPPADDDSAHGGDPGPDSGEPTDALFYEELVTKTIDSGQTAGTYTGMVRALDPEIAADTSSWKFPLRPDLTPANPAPDPIAYQAFQVLMATPSDPPTVTLTTPREVLSGETTTIEVTAATDPDGDTILLEIDWDNDGIFEDTQRIEPPYDVPVTLTRPDNAIYANPTLDPQVRAIPVRVSDGSTPPVLYTPELTYTLGPNRPPQIEGGPGLSLAEPCLASPATFTVTLEGVSVVDPEGDPITYTVTGTPNAGDPVQATDIPSFPYSGPPTGPWSSPPVTNVRFTGFANDPLHPAAEGTPLIPDSGVVGTVGSAPFVRTVGGGLGDLGYAVSTDNAGNILVAGVFRGTVDFDPGPGSSPRTSQGEWDGFVAKFDAGGQFLWVASWGGENYDEAFAAEADPEGNVFVTGRFSSTTVDFDPGPGEEPRTNSGGYDCYAVRLDPTGNLQWAAAWGGGGNDKSTGLALDPRGAPHMAGSFIGTVDFDPGAGTVERTSGGGSDDSFLLKLDPETGAFADLLTLGNDVSDYAEDVEFDSAGNLVLAGIFQTTMDFDPGPDVQNRTAVGFSPYLLKLDPRFSYTWVAALGVSSSLGLTFHGLDIDPTDAVYLGSEFSIGTDFDAGPGVEPRAPVGATDAFVVKYDSMGSFQWVAAVGGGGGDWGRGVAADGEAVYLAGEFNNTVDFDPGAGSAPLTSAGSGDAYLLKLTAAGEYVWASRWGAGQQDLAYDVSLRAGCDPLTTGTFQGLVDFDPGAGTSEVSAVGSFDAFLLKLRGDTGTL